jgi:hypothetical protein
VGVRFVGELDGRPLESFRGTLERAGSSPYLLLGVQSEGAGPRYILDIEPVDGSGPRRVQISLTGPQGDRLVGRAQVHVQAQGDDRRIDGLAVDLGDGDRRRRLAGRVEWTVDATLPAEVIGELRVQLDGRDAGPTPSSLAPFDDHWRAVAVLVLAPGETLHLTLRLPGPVEGTWTDPAAGLDAVWTRMGEALDIQVRHLQGIGLQARAVLEGDQLAVDLRGALRGDDGPAVGLRLRFAGRRTG